MFVDNEANLGALAEARAGAARGTRGAAYIRVGHTISAGLLIDGAVFRGVTGKAGQIGHVTIDENGPICKCGSRGCLDTLAGGPALLELFRDDPSVQRIRDLLLRAEAGDASSRRVIADAGRHIGIAVASLSNLFDPECLVIGGELALAGETLLAPLRHALERSALAGGHGVPEVLQGELGEQAELIGCLALAIESVGIDAERPRRHAPCRARTARGHGVIAPASPRRCAAGAARRRRRSPGASPATPARSRSRCCCPTRRPRATRPSTSRTSPTASTSSGDFRDPLLERRPGRLEAAVAGGGRAGIRGRRCSCSTRSTAPPAVSIVAAANAQGVPVIAYDRFISGGDLAFYVSFDNDNIGTAAGRGADRRSSTTTGPRAAS